MRFYNIYNRNYDILNHNEDYFTSISHRGDIL